MCDHPGESGRRLRQRREDRLPAFNDKGSSILVHGQVQYFTFQGLKGFQKPAGGSEPLASVPGAGLFSNPIFAMTF